ncbi:hypothetical protein AYI69_g3869 [Smittium culicis]|uniref:CCHC-type domain-containing protein n=1 Tax=Smittium culicis TaxID=133412 RepID=A0A1R1YIL5_9FUNG|nr:hypothetical protein AYI69_g3869 [Smittium culicis]
MKNKFSRRFTEKKQLTNSIRPLVSLIPKKGEGIREFNFRFMETLDLIIPEISHPATVKSIYSEAIISIDSELSWILSNEQDYKEWSIEKLLKEANILYLKRKKYASEPTEKIPVTQAKSEDDNSLAELTKQFSRIALLLEEKKKKEEIVVRCYSCNSVGHVSTNCPNRNNSYRGTQKNNYSQKEQSPLNNPSGVNNQKYDSKDVMLFEKVEDRNLLVAHKRMRIDNLLDDSTSNDNHKIKKTTKKKNITIKKTKKKSKVSKASEWSKKVLETPVPLSLKYYLIGKPKAVNELIIGLKETNKKKE